MSADACTIFCRYLSGRLHLRHPQLQKQGGRDQEDQQGTGKHQVQRGQLTP